MLLDVFRRLTILGDLAFLRNILVELVRARVWVMEIATRVAVVGHLPSPRRL